MCVCVCLAGSLLAKAVSDNEYKYFENEEDLKNHERFLLMKADDTSSAPSSDHGLEDADMAFGIHRRSASIVSHEVFEEKA